MQDNNFMTSGIQLVKNISFNLESFLEAGRRLPEHTEELATWIKNMHIAGTTLFSTVREVLISPAQ